MENFKKILSDSLSIAGREGETSPFSNANGAKERFAFCIGKILSYNEQAAKTLATLAAFHNGDPIVAERIGNILNQINEFCESAILPDSFAIPTVRIGARVRIDPRSMSANYVTNPAGMRTIVEIDGSRATLTGGIMVPVSDLVPVK